MGSHWETSLVLTLSWFFSDFASAGLKTHKIGRLANAANALAQWCALFGVTNPCHMCVRKPGTNSRGISNVPLRWCGSWGSNPVLGTASRGCSTLLFGGDEWNHETPDHKMASELLLLSWLFLSIGGKWGTYQMKAHGPLHQFGWPAADRVANDVLFKMAVLLVPLNLCLEIRWCQRELSKGHHSNRSNTAGLPILWTHTNN